MTALDWGLYWADDGVHVGTLGMSPETFVVMAFVAAPPGVPRVRMSVIPRKEYFYNDSGKRLALPVPTVDSWIPLGEPVFMRGEVWTAVYTRDERGEWVTS